MNQVQLIGRLGQDPKMNPKGTICNLNLATNGRGKVDGEWVTTTEWHNIVCFGKTAENVAKFCGKGSQVGISGRLQTRKWEDKEGNARYTTEVVANEVEFIGAKKESSNAAQGEDEELMF
jgi:single-strand DNA-binding protein